MAESPPARRIKRADLRRILLTMSAILALGLISAKLGEPGLGDAWFDRLVKPSLMPPRWAYAAITSLLYLPTGLALAVILGARGSTGRAVAILIFLVQLGLHLAWPAIFFAMHRVMLGFGLLLATLCWAGITTLIFWHIRRSAALLMLPYLAWVMFACWQNWQVHRLNPYGATLVPSTGDTQIIIQ